MRNANNNKRHQGMREQAKALLEDFLVLVAPYEFPSKRLHFPEFFDHLGLGGEALSDPDSEVVEVLFRVLAANANLKIIDRADLAILTEALNRNSPGPIQFLGRNGGQGHSPRGMYPLRPYDFAQKQSTRIWAEMILGYINLTWSCGPVHTICQRPECGSMTMKWRGGRKYCSIECREQRWSYTNRKSTGSQPEMNQSSAM